MPLKGPVFLFLLMKGSGFGDGLRVGGVVGWRGVFGAEREDLTFGEWMEREMSLLGA